MRGKNAWSPARKAEGKAIVYGNISADHLEKLRIDFDKRYGVKLDGYRASGERVANRLLDRSEQRQARCRRDGAEQRAYSGADQSGCRRAI